MTTSTITERGQTTVPLEIREALQIGAGHRLVWTSQADGSVVIRPLPSVMDLAGSLKSKVAFSSINEETDASTSAWVSQTKRKQR